MAAFNPDPRRLAGSRGLIRSRLSLWRTVTGAAVQEITSGAAILGLNGSIYSVNGSYLHRLNADDLHVENERALVDCGHNGLLALGDGSLFTKDLRLDGQGVTTLSRFDETSSRSVLHSPCPKVRPNASPPMLARWCRARYVPGTEHVFRVVIDGERMALDGWRLVTAPSGARTDRLGRLPVG